MIATDDLSRQKLIWSYGLTKNDNEIIASQPARRRAGSVSAELSKTVS